MLRDVPARGSGRVKPPCKPRSGSGAGAQEVECDVFTCCIYGGCNPAELSLWDGAQPGAREVGTHGVGCL